MSNIPFAVTLSPSAQATADQVRADIAAGKTRAAFCANYATAGDTFFAYAIISACESGLVTADDETFKAGRKAYCETFSSDSKSSVRAYATEVLSLSRRMAANNLDWSQIGSMRDLRTIARYKAPKDVISTGEAGEFEAKQQAEAEAVRKAIEAETANKAQAEAANKAQAEAEAANRAATRFAAEAEAAKAEAARIRQAKTDADADAVKTIEALKAEIVGLKAQLTDMTLKLESATKARKSGTK